MASEQEKKIWPGPLRTNLDVGTSASGSMPPGRGTSKQLIKAHNRAQPTPSRGRISVPTKATLTHHLCVIPRNPWVIYERIEYTTKQGLDSGSKAILSRRRQHVTEAPDDCLYVIKHLESHAKSKPIKTLPKLRHEHLVTLHCVFREDRMFALVYEEMDLSLQQILGIDRETLINDREREQMPIESICGQALCGLLYIHSCLNLAHGQVCSENVLLKRNGVVKLANIGFSILIPSGSLIQDFQDLDMVVGEIQEASREISHLAPARMRQLEDVRSLLCAGKGQQASQHLGLYSTQYGTPSRNMVLLAVRMFRMIYDPPDPILAP